MRYRESNVAFSNFELDLLSSRDGLKALPCWTKFERLSPLCHKESM